MFKTTSLISAAVIIAILSACSAHSPMIVKSTTDSSAAESEYPAHTNAIFLTKQTLPDAVSYEPISQIDVGKVWYGSTKGVYESMAVRARELGANAVINVKTWRQPSGFSWAAPHGSGLAVRVEDENLLKSLDLQGEWH